ncbi:MAG TPA: YbaB/EbfC family nucleoid-associated protein [Actinoplanes sp.]|nr:YbaB/EbfC family nucleoid-associated protein [Actinoplanes sp.]
MLDRKLDDAGGWVRSWSSQVSGRAEAATALADRVAVLTASATGAEGAIRVTVTSSGNLTELELADDVRRLSGAALAEQIMRVYRRAQAGLTERVAEAVGETVGAETETGRAVLESFAHRFPAQGAEPEAPVMPAPPPFPTFQNKPTLPHQPPGNGFESGRDSRAR